MKYTRHFLVPLLILVFFMGLTPGEGTPKDSPISKLNRGVTNILTGWTEFGYHAGKQVDDHKPVRGFIGAFMYGTYYTFWRTLAGVYETATFIIPVPWHYKTVIKPETLV